MYFFHETSLQVSQSRGLGQWDLSGYREFALHAWIKGAGGASCYLEIYFNGLSAAGEQLTIGGTTPGGWGISTLAKTYPVFAPRMAVVLYNPSGPLDLMMRLYAACCESEADSTPPAGPSPWNRVKGMLGRKEPVRREDQRVLSPTVDLASLRGRWTEVAADREGSPVPPGSSPP
jgi:hypothetical protein